MNVLNIVTAMRFRNCDIGVLKVALMVAALDGKVLECEYKAFRLFARDALGYSDSEIAEALARAMHVAGYIMLSVSRGISEREIVELFLSEAKSVLPKNFAYMPIEIVRRAIVIWIAMAMSDEDYSRREKACIGALRECLATEKAKFIEQEHAYLRSQPAAVRCAVEKVPGVSSELVSKDFMGKVAAIMTEFGGKADARRLLDELVAKGE